MLEKINIIDQETAQDLLRYIEEDKPDYEIKKLPSGLQYNDNDYEVTIPQEFAHLFQQEDEYTDSLIYGKNLLREIVSIEVNNNNVEIFLKDGSMVKKPMVYWMVSNTKLDKHFTKLEGKQHYKYIRRFVREETFKKYCRIYYKKDTFQVHNAKEAAMIYYGYTMFKGLKIEDVPILSFDIESAGLTHDEDSKVFLITNTFRKDGNITKKHFRLDYYENDEEMIRDWCSWVVEMDPIILNGHNHTSFDVPYLQYCFGGPLPLGKGGKPIEIETRESNFRVDGNQKWTYNKIHVYGRHMVDGVHLAVKYDIGRNYPSWGLKQIAEYEGLVKEDRQFYDASKIKDNWHNPEEREKIIAYGIDDSDDSLALYDLHAPSIFYMCQSVPKPYQLMTQSASGAQLNAIMVRAYMQEGHSIPKASEKEYVAGGMSYGIPGVYTNVLKWDAKSYYPSTIITFDIYDKEKDPNAYFLKMVKHFTYKRFDQKDMYKQTGDKYYDDLQAASKVFINSAYGLLGTPGLNFNSYKNAQLITKCCRAGLQKAILWATGKKVDNWWPDYLLSKTHEQDFKTFQQIDKKAKVSRHQMAQHDWQLVNLDTDSLSFAKQDGSEYTEEEKGLIFKELNDIMYSEWEDDGSFDKVLVAKAKNYVLINGNKKKVKGSSLTDTKKEPALVEMLNTLVDDLLDGGENTNSIYHKYIAEAYNIQDISRWATKKSVTAKVLNPERTNEQVVLNAIKDKNPREGDKFYLYTALDGERQKVAKGEPVFLKSGAPSMMPNNILKCVEDWSKDDYKEHYVKRVYMTLCILENLLDLNEFTKYHLKSNWDKIPAVISPLGRAINGNTLE
jgi:DNA polymerase elongation subunit (family B)